MFSKIKVVYCQFQLDRLKLRTEEIHEAHREAFCGYYDAEDATKHGRFADTDKALRSCEDARIEFDNCAKRESDHLARMRSLRRRISLLTSSRVDTANTALLQ